MPTIRDLLLLEPPDFRTPGRLDLRNTLSNIAKDPKLVDELHTDIAYFKRLTGGGVRAFLTINSFADREYLLDFSVVRDFLIGDPSSANRVFLDYLFYDPNAPYFSLPIGTLGELQAWLESAVDLRRMLGAARSDELRPETILDLLRILLRRPYKAGAALDIVNDAVEDSFSHLNIGLNRLVYLLEHERRRETNLDYSGVDVYTFLDYLDVVRRTEPRNNHYDALNLAVVLSAYRKSLANRKQETIYVLATDTKILRDLADDLERPGPDLQTPAPEKQRDHSPASKLIFEIVEELTPLGLTTSDIPLPCVRPRHILTAEIAGAFSKDYGLTELQDYNYDFMRLCQIVERWQFAHKRGRNPVAAESFPSDVDKFAARVRSIWVRRNRSDATSSIGSFILMGTLRSTAKTVYDAFRSQHFQSSPPRSEGRSTFLALMRDLYNLLNRRIVFNYMFLNVPTLQTYGSNDSTRFVISQRPPLPFNSPLIAGHIHGAERGSRQGDYLVELEWPVVSTVDDFIEEFKKLVTPSPELVESSSLPLIMQRSHGGVENEGDSIVFFTDSGHYRAPTGLLYSSDLERTSVLAIASAAIRASYPDVGSTDGPNIRQIALNTGFCSWVIDVVNIEGEWRRYLRFVSRYNLAKHISCMFQHTSTMPSTPSALAKVLEVGLSSLMPPEYSSAGVRPND